MRPQGGAEGGAKVAFYEGNSRSSQPKDRASSLSPRYQPNVLTHSLNKASQRNLGGFQRARRGVPAHRAEVASTQRGTSHTAHPKPPTPAAAPSPRRRNTSATAASSAPPRPAYHPPADASQPHTAGVWRRALSRDHPVTPTTSSRIRPLSPFPAFTYAFAYLVVTSAREFIESSFSIPNNAHRYAGIPT